MWCTGTDHACGAVDCVEMFCSVVDVNAGSHHVPILHLEEQLGDQSLKESGFENAALGRSCRPPNGSAPCSTLTCDKLGVVGRERTANMIPSGGYRNFSDYASANNPRDSYLMNVQELLNQERGLSGGTSRFLDSDSDSDYEYSDARSQLGEQQILEARYGRNQIFYIQPDPVTPGDYLHQAFEVAAECKVSSAVSLCRGTGLTGLIKVYAVLAESTE